MKQRSASGRRHSNTHQRRRARYHRRRLGLMLAAAALVAAFALAAVLAGGSGSASGSSGDSAPKVREISIDGTIDPPMADYVTSSLAGAERDKVQAVVLRLDTPGGLDQSMRDIIKKMETSPLPVIAYVSPSGARAASAGTFICMAADVAAMASGTNLGAAHPVAIGASPSSVEGRKIINDAAAYIRALAEANGHNADWAELAVRQSVSLTASDALSQKVIDFQADSLSSLFRQLDGFKTKAKGITLHLSGAAVTQAGMSFKDRVLEVIVNPNVAYVLLIFGLLSLAYEFFHPGIGLGVIAGIIALILSSYALYLLPVNYIGAALVLLGVILLGAELFVPAHGVLTLGGAISLIAGSFFLYNTSASFLRVSLPLNIFLAVLSVAFFLFVARSAYRARRMPVQNPRAALIGATGPARTTLDPLGQVFIHGEIWSAEAPPGEIIEKGEEIEVNDVNGLMLKVRKT